MPESRLAIAVLFTFFSLAATARAETLGAVLTGSQEFPQNSSPAFGEATFTLDAPHTSLSVSLSVSGLSAPITGAHIHGEAPAGQNAGVLINFLPSGGPAFNNGRLTATYTIDKTVGDRIATRPDLFYANVHTSQFPGGEIRGQLTSSDDVMKLAADLRGVNERPNPVSTEAKGAALVTIDANNLLTFEVNSNGLVSPTAAHIHRGASDVAGGVVVSFVTGGNAFTGGRIKGTAQLDAALANEIRGNPGGFYVNVHTSANGGGEIRGQLIGASEYDIAVAGKATGSRGENFVTDVRIFNPSYTQRASALVEYFAAGSPNTNATVSTAVDIPPRGLAVLNDVAGSSFLNAANGTGAIRVTGTSALAVASRIYDDRRGGNGGTIGQFVPAVQRSGALRSGVMVQLANNSGSRTNVGFFNPTTSAVSVRLELRDASGTLLGTRVITLGPLSQEQTGIGIYFVGIDLSDRPALSVSFDASAPIVAYASVLDNVSADQIFVPAQPDPGIAP